MENNLANHIALVSETDKISFGEVARVSAALQKQVMRDFTPVWNIYASVDAFAALEDVPIDYWPIIIREDIDKPGVTGVHCDNEGHPFGLVKFSQAWSLTASHECLEMLCDPSGNKVTAGKSPMEGQGRVEFLVEVCDPSEADTFAYTANGITVSDFYTPRYFDPVAVPGVQYSYTGALTKPREVLKGGYLSWHDPVTDHWFQQIFFGAESEFRDLGILNHAEGSIRTLINQQTPEAFKKRPPNQNVFVMASKLFDEAATAGSAKAQLLRRQIDRLLER